MGSSFPFSLGPTYGMNARNAVASFMFAKTERKCIRVVPHGTDNTLFYLLRIPLVDSEDSIELMWALLGWDSDTTDKCVMVNMGVYDPNPVVAVPPEKKA